MMKSSEQQNKAKSSSVSSESKVPQHSSTIPRAQNPDLAHNPTSLDLLWWLGDIIALKGGELS